MASSLDEVECQAARVMDIVDSDQQGSRGMGVDRFDESKTQNCRLSLSFCHATLVGRSTRLISELVMRWSANLSEGIRRDSWRGPRCYVTF